jgi:hypothetical protein
MTIFEVVNSIYKKQPMVVDKLDIGLCIALTNILRLNKNNLLVLKKIVNYLFFIEPKRYLMLLFVSIPQQTPPFIKGIKKQEEQKEDLLYTKISYILDWSKKELKLYKPLLDKIIDRKYWCSELGVKK